jgi:hypothetical protein
MAFLNFKVSAQSLDYRFHSIFIYNFTKYIQWPASQQSADFVIGVFGNSPISEELEKITSNKTVGTQKIVIKRFRNLSEVSDCHILFISSNGSNNFEAVQEKLKGKSTLLITEKSGLIEKGSCINFVLQDNKWRFQLNEAAAQNAGLKISKELAQMATTA